MKIANVNLPQVNSFVKAGAKCSGKVIIKIDNDNNDDAVNMSTYLMVAASPKQEPKAAARFSPRLVPAVHARAAAAPDLKYLI